MKERTLQRLHNIDARFGERIREKDRVSSGDRATFDEAFSLARAAVLIPVFEEVARDLEARGFHAAVETSERSPTHEGPSATLRVHITPRRPAGHRVSFVVIERGPAPQVLALLEATPPVTDIARYQPADLTRDVVEQVLLDALEHIFACIAEIP